MAQLFWTTPSLPQSRLNAELGYNALPLLSQPTVRQETAEELPTAHTILPEDPVTSDPDDEIIDDPSKDPDPLEPPVEEPPPGWGA